jgi:hypothetical protein
MQNLLTPKGLRPRRKQLAPPTQLHQLPRYDHDPMPSTPMGWIMDGDGPRQLLLDETAHGLGLTKSRDVPSKVLTLHLLHNTTSVFHWEYISQCFLQLMDTSAPTVSDLLPVPTADGNVSPDAPALEATYPDWKPPDMTPSGEWHTTRVERLCYDCSFYDDGDSLFQDGLTKLVRHRQNYDSEGPTSTQLQLLWWEFPESQWKDIQLGGSMNFLTEPIHQIQPNSPMGSEELKVAVEFI